MVAKPQSSGPGPLLNKLSHRCHIPCALMAMARPFSGEAAKSLISVNPRVGCLPWYINTLQGSNHRKLINNTNARNSAQANDRVQTRVLAEASSPAPNAKQIELKFTRPEITTSGQPMPPPRKHTVKTGRTA